MMNRKRFLLMIGLMILFGTILTFFRIQWVKTFNEAGEHPVIEKGELDLRNWDFSENETVPLNGEWTFLPYELIEKGSDIMNRAEQSLIKVPGDWSETLNPADKESFGYGTYHLRILVNPDEQQTYSMQVPSVRSASALYVNGLYSGKSGEVSDNEKDAHAFNVPYLSSTIRADEAGVIDIVLQATNFADPRSSGLVRSIKFGYEDKIIADSRLSTILQVMTAVILLVFAIFSIILYSIGIRDRRFIYFAIALIVNAFSSLMSGDEKVLFNYVPLDYTFTFKWAFTMLIIFGWSMVHCVKPQIQSLSKRFLPIYSTVSVMSIVVAMVLPLEALDYASVFSLAFVLISAILTAVALLIGRKEYKGGVWLALSAIALASHFGWWIYTLSTGLKVIYYPFDLMIAIICFGGVWFKQYHEMHLETKKLAEELRLADEAKNTFLANTSHELRNPLHSILNLSEAILERERTMLQERSVKDLETVLSVSRRMSTMVTELLDLEQIEKGTPHMAWQPCSIKAIASGVVDMLDYTIEGKPIQLICKIPVDFPLIMADEKRMIQILFNLVHNAIKFTNEGEITIDAHKKGDYAEITISDTGIGVTEQEMQAIFEPYKQVHYRQSGGFGLGLSICKKLVELHGSQLNMNSIIGEGSTFSFKIPLADDEALTEMTLHSVESFQLSDYIESTTEGATTVSIKNPRILVVDDDAVNLQVVKAMLEVESYFVKAVLSGEEALVLLAAGEWDLVISDVMMPGMSGYELTGRIRERFTVTELPVLLLTASSGPLDLENGFIAGANDYVRKPMESLEFKSRVRALVSVKQSMQEKLEIEAAWLQAQIQPHFIFNTLNTIIALSEIDLGRMRKVLEAFSHLLRGKFRFDERDEMVPIDKELGLIRSYLHIERERFGDRLNLTWAVDDHISCLIPSLTIQPLVENAIHHGIMKRLEGGSLMIQVKREDGYVLVTVEDDGVGMTQACADKLLTETVGERSSIGLFNTNLRLKRRYGRGLEINSEKGIGTSVSFRVPDELVLGKRVE